MKQDLKNRLIDTMFTSLYHEGYNASNLNDLLKRAGTSKGGLYHHFESKKDLALQTSRIVIGDFIHHYWEVGLNKDKNPIKALEVLLNELPNTPILGETVFDFQYGCPLDKLIQEMSSIDDDFHILLNSLFSRWIEVVDTAFRRAEKNKIIQKDIDTRMISEFIVASIEGCLTMSKIRRCESSYQHCVATLIRFLKTLQRREV